MSAYIAARDDRFWHATDAIQAIEWESCYLGCRRGAQTVLEWETVGPGGSCGVLALIAIGDGQRIPEIEDDGKKLACQVREPVE